MPVYLHKLLLILLYLFCALSLFSMALGLPGIWVLVAVALIFALATHFTAITWFYLLLCVGLAVLGEIIESVLGVAVVAKKGGGRYGIFGTFLGGLLGVIAGAPLAPPFGSLVLGFAGSFAGAVAGEYIAYRKLESAVRVGYWAFLGRALAIVVKLGLGFAILWIIVVKTW
ncbi:MAG: DUF456 domain-containing protein [Chitinivibrionia bacterium]|nr:DUF456 domain-containing protein [Chitinivibrionia bacterium]